MSGGATSAGAAARPSAMERFHKYSPLLSLALLGLALWGLHGLLAQHHLKDLWLETQSIPSSVLWRAAAWTLLSYLLLTFYDHLALRYVDRPLPYPGVALTSFITYAFSHNLGAALLSGGSVRLRLYTAQGVGALEVAQVMGFSSAAFWSGYGLLAGWALAAYPDAASWLPGFPPLAHRAAGILLLALVLTGLAVPFLREKPFRLGQWEWPVPGRGMSLALVGLSAVDWCAAAAAMYVLLPPEAGISFQQLLFAYLLAQLAGNASQVPGGVGVFEAGMLLFLGPHMPAQRAGAVLFAYRALYYVAPFLLSVALLGVYEFLERRHLAGRLVDAVGRRLSPLVPPVAAVAVFFMGSVMMLTGSYPARPGHPGWLEGFLPLGVVELSHFTASIVGASLLAMASGLWRRVASAHHLACLLTAAGIAAALLKGMHWAQASACAVVLFFLLGGRKEFFRKAELLDEPFSVEWSALVASALLCTVWLGLFAHKHVPYSDDLWWRFSLASGSASRFLRASLGASVTLLLFAAAHLLSPATPEPEPAGSDDLARAVRVLSRHPRTSGHLALVGDKTLLWDKGGEAFIMYAVEGRSWVAMGDPVGPEAAWPDLVWDFKDLVARHDGLAAFYQVAPERLHVYADAGFSLLKLGEEALVPLTGFSLQGGEHKALRQTVNKLEREGCSFEILPAEAVSGVLPELKAVSDSWMAEKSTREKGFSLGRFDEAYLRRSPVALARAGGRIAGFANLWLGGGKAELSLDLMRYHPDAPHGIMDFLFARLMLWGAEQGYGRFNLGMAPLSGLERRRSSPVWNKIGELLFRHGEHFYNFQGLRQYKEKFHPVWEPRYLACPGGAAVLKALMSISALVSGGVQGALTK